MICLLAIDVSDFILGAVGEHILSFAVLDTVSPQTNENFSIGIVKSAFSIATVVFEFTIVNLPVCPEVLAVAMLFTGDPLAFVNPAIRPSEESVSFHLVLRKVTLINLSFACDSSSDSIALSVLEVPFIQRSSIVNFDAHSIWSLGLLISLAPELGPGSSLDPLHLHASLIVFIELIIIFFGLFRLFLEEVKRAQHIVDGSDFGLAQFFVDMVEI